MTCPGGSQCTCTSIGWVVGGGGDDHAFSFGLPNMRWWIKAVEREFEGAGRADLYFRDHLLIEGVVRFPDNGVFRLPTMAYAIEPRAYGPYWREAIGRALRGESGMIEVPTVTEPS